MGCKLALLQIQDGSSRYLGFGFSVSKFGTAMQNDTLMAIERKVEFQRDGSGTDTTFHRRYF